MSVRLLMPFDVFLVVPWGLSPWMLFWRRMRAEFLPHHRLREKAIQPKKGNFGDSSNLG